MESWVSKSFRAPEENNRSGWGVVRGIVGKGEQMVTGEKYCNELIGFQDEGLLLSNEFGGGVHC